MIDSATRELVISRAENRCEYCHLPQAGYEATFHLDHINASQHDRNDDPANLALACPKCNRKKGPNIAGVDPDTQTIVPLFNPRKDVWRDHFDWNGPLVVGLTSCGRATMALLDLNSDERVRLRMSLLAEGVIDFGK